MNTPIPTPEEARDILARYNRSHFRMEGEKARYSIPVRHDHDDDVRLAAFIDHAERMQRETAAKDAQIAKLREALEFYANRQHELDVTNDEDCNEDGAFGQTAREALAATPESAAQELAELRKAVAGYQQGLTTGLVAVSERELAELRKERDNLAAWKESALTVESWWKKIDDFVRAQPDAPLGLDVSAIALKWLLERDELLKDKARLDWLDKNKPFLGPSDREEFDAAMQQEAKPRT